MAQFLKPETREKIMESATGEFLERGYEDSSMRRIRDKSGMTVGNLYRYFANKDELLKLVTAPAYNAIDALVRKLTGDMVSIKEDFITDLDPRQLHGLIDGLSGGLVDVCLKHRARLGILMMDSRINKSMVSWFSGAIESLICSSADIEKGNPSVTALSGAYAVSVFEGVKEIIRTCDPREGGMKEIISLYLDSYVYMLSNEAITKLGKDR